VPSDALSNDESVERVCSHYQNGVNMYDASWLIPGKMMVSADPMTTIRDPNPSTCCAMYPDGATATQVEASTPSTTPRTSAGAIETTNSLPAVAQDSPLKAPSTEVSYTVSTDTICKEFQFNGSGEQRDSETPLDFVTFLKRRRVTLVVRTNFADEAGMPKKGYNGQDLAKYGINHMEILIVDQYGGNPKRNDIARLLEASREIVASDKGILVHCKGGFGRSMIMACCLAIDAFNVSGRALLGWARIARTGAINTVQQEQLLASWQNANAVRKFAGLETPNESKATATQSCNPPCAIL